MKQLYLTAFVVAAIGYIISVFLYGLTFNDVNTLVPLTQWPLMFSMVGIGGIAVVKLAQNTELKELKEKGESSDLRTLKAMFKGTPIWVSVIGIASFVFGMISFGIIMKSHPGDADIIDGEYVILNQGDIIKKLNEQEYIQELAIRARQFMGFYLAWFGWETAILYPNKRKENNL